MKFMKPEKKNVNENDIGMAVKNVALGRVCQVAVT